MAKFMTFLTCFTLLGLGASDQNQHDLVIEASITGPVFLYERIIISCTSSSSEILNVTWMRKNETTDYAIVESAKTSATRTALVTATLIIAAEKGDTYCCIGVRKDGTANNVTFRPDINGTAEVITTIGLSNAQDLSKTVILVNPTSPISLNCHVRRDSSPISSVGTSLSHPCHLNSSVASFGPGYVTYTCGMLGNSPLAANNNHECYLTKLLNGVPQLIRGQPVNILIRHQEFEFKLEEQPISNSSHHKERCYLIDHNSRTRISGQKCVATNISDTRGHPISRRSNRFCIDKVLSGETVQVNCTGTYEYPIISFGLHGGILYSQHVFHVNSVVAGQTLPVTSSTVATVTGMFGAMLLLCNLLAIVV